MMEIKTAKDIYGRDYDYLKAGLVKGRNWLVSQGYSQCENPNYYKRENMYAHYNSFRGEWFFEAETNLTTVA